MTEHCLKQYFLSLKFFFFQAEDGIRDLVRARGLGDVYKGQGGGAVVAAALADVHARRGRRRLVQEGRAGRADVVVDDDAARAADAYRAAGEALDPPRPAPTHTHLSLIHIRRCRRRGQCRSRWSP